MTPAPGPRRLDGWVFRLALRCWPPSIRTEAEGELRATFEARRGRGGGGVDLVLEGLDIARAGIRARFWSTGRVSSATPREEGVMGTMGSVVRHGLRGLARSRRWAVLTGGVLAVGVAATAGVFAVVDAVAVRDLPYPAPDRLVRIGAEREGRPGLSTLSGPNARDVARASRTLASLAAVTPSTMGIAAADGSPELVRGGWVSGGFFSTLEVAAAHGRVLGAADDEPTAAFVVVLGHALARRLFGDEAATGRTLAIDGRPATVVGVMGPDFHPPEGVNLGETALWAPLAHAPLPVEERGLAFLDVVGRLAPDVPFATAESELRRIGQGLVETHALSPRAFAALAARPLRAETVEGARPVLALLLAAVGLVLAIAALNAANLILLRVLDRVDALRVRMALGASRARVVAESVVESTAVAVLGGGVGLAAASAAVRAVVAARPVDLPRLTEATVDARTAAVALGLALAVGAVAGLVPALVAVGEASLARTRRAGSSRGRGARLLRDGVVVLQVAVGLALAGSAALVARSLAERRNVPVGLDPAHLHVATLRIEGIGGETFRPALLDDLLDRLRSRPGVVAAGLGSGSPYVPGGFVGYLEPEGVDVSDEDRMRGRVEFHRTSAEPLGLLGIPVLRGRDLASSDREDTEAVVVVSSATARAWWGEVDPLGRTVVVGGDGTYTPRRVVGVAADPRYRGPAADPEQHVWIPWRQMPAAPLDLLVRTDGAVSPERVVAEAVAGVPGVQVRGMRSVERERAARFVEPTFFTLLFGFFATAALLLAVVGLYSTLAHGVRARRTELGIRMVLGADRGRLIRGVVTRGAAVTGAGLAVGAVLSFAGARLTSSLLFGVRPGDVAAWSAAAGVLLLAALAASGVPAWRAGRTEPVRSLRTE